MQNLIKLHLRGWTQIFKFQESRPMNHLTPSMDPTTTMAVAVGKEAARKADSYLGLILKPMLATVGKELDERVKEKFEEMRSAQRSKNLQHHIQKAEEIAVKNATKPKKAKASSKRAHVINSDEAATSESPTTEAEPSLQIINNLEKWIAGARDVSASDSVMAPVWQQMLADMLVGKDVDEMVVNKLREINSKELELLMHVGLRKHGMCYLFAHELGIVSLDKPNDPFFENSLIAKGLVAKSWFLWARLLSLTILYSMSVILLTYGWPAARPTSVSETGLRFGFYPLIFVLTIGAFLLMHHGLRLRRLKPTWLGRRILDLVEQTA